METVASKFNSLIQQIAKTRSKQKRLNLIKGIILSLSYALALFLFFSLLELVFRFDTDGRIFLFMLFMVTMMAAVVIYIVRPVILLFRKKFPSDEAVAKNIGNFFPAIKDKLTNAVQVFKIKAENPHGFSCELIDETIEKMSASVENVDFNLSVSHKPAAWAGKIFSSLVVVYLFFVFLLGVKFRSAEFRLIHPFTEFKTPPEISIIVTPGNKHVLKNEVIKITATVQGEKVERLDLHLKEIHNEYHLTHTIEARIPNEFEFIIDHIQDTTEYYFVAEEIATEKFVLTVLDLPLVRNLQISLTHPDYVGKGTEKLDENIGDINCLKGSYAQINLTSNKRLSQAKLILNGEKEIPLNTNLNMAEGGFKIFAEGSYFIKLIDQENLENKDPIEYHITLIEDIYPHVFITFPGQDVDLAEDLILPVTIEADDDYGFSNLRLGFSIIKMDNPVVDSTYHFIDLPIKTKQTEKIVLEYFWDLTQLDIFAGDIVRYYAEVFDNDNVSGPKNSKSQIYSARFPTLEEIYAEVNNEQEQTSENFEGLYEKSKDLKENLDKLTEELKQNPELKWEEKKEIENILENQKQLEQSLDEVKEQLDQMIERMERNDLLSLETLQKYSELQKLLDEVMTEELKEAIKNLQKAAEKIDEQLMKQAIEQLNFTQEEFLRNIEKTLNILKRLQMEQKLDELVKRTEQLLQQQTDINEQLHKELSTDQKNGVREQQDETKNKTSEALNETDQLRNNMSEFAKMPEKMLEQIIQQMQDDGLLKNMDQVISQLQSGDRQNAQRSGKSAQMSLSQMHSMLSQAKKEMIEKQKQEVMAEMQRLSNNLLSLSKEQEELLNQSKNLNINSPQLNQRADNQQDLMNALSRSANQMGELSQKTFFVSSQMMRSVGQSLQNMNEALKQFEERNMASAARAEQKAMISLNDAIKQMMSAMKELASASSAAGLDEFLQKLSKMASSQQGINEQTLQLNPGSQPLSLSQQASMARLAAEQAALRKTMEQLQKEYGERSDVLGRLDQIGKEMEDVVKDLQSRNVDRKTIDRQQRILQRLLDAQKSARKQDYSRKRKAETGKYYPAISPGQLPANLGEKNIQIQRDLIKALKEGYAKDYQDLIKKYFEALMKESVENETSK